MADVGTVKCSANADGAVRVIIASVAQDVAAIAAIVMSVVRYARIVKCVKLANKFVLRAMYAHRHCVTRVSNVMTVVLIANDAINVRATMRLK